MDQAGWIWAAAAISAVTFAIHLFVGGIRVARPLLADTGLPRASKWLNYFCWHIVTVLLAIMALGYGGVATGRLHPDVARLLGVMAASFFPLSAAVAIKGGIAPWRFPSTTLFALIALATLTAFLP